MTATAALGIDQAIRRSDMRPSTGMRWSNDEPTVTLKLDLSDLPIPHVHNLQVEGLEKPWWQRLLGH